MKETCAHGESTVNVEPARHEVTVFCVGSLPLRWRNQLLLLFLLLLLLLLLLIFQADAIEQHGRRDNMKNSGVTEEPGEDVYRKVVDVEQEAGLLIAKEDISVCHRLTTQKLGPNFIVAKFVRPPLKHNMMANKKI